MNRNTWLVLAVAAVAIFLFVNPLRLFRGGNGVMQRATVPAADLSALSAWAEKNAWIPEAYVTQAFARHDIVFLGEFYKIRQHVQLVSALIPPLYRAGVRNLGIEYALSDDQGAIDALVTGRSWDEAAARKILFDWVVTWGFQEYVDIFKSAWQLNRSLPAGAPPFRIVGLSVRQNWQYLTSDKDARDPRVVARIFSNGIPDAHMAEIIDREFIRRGQKALVFCGAQHAFTAYRSPDYEKSAADLKLSETRRAGNIVFAEIGRRAFSISLHAPWPDPGSRTGLAWPADGVIDALIDALPPEKKSAGFDTAGTPLGALRVTSGGYARSAGQGGGARLRLEDLFDGYVILGPLATYRAVTPIPDFVQPQDTAVALQQFPGAKPPSLTADQANAFIAGDAAAVDRLLAQFR